MSFQSQLTTTQIVEYEKIVNLLRMHELQKVLEAVHEKKTGLKSDLASRLIKILKESPKQLIAAATLDSLRRSGGKGAGRPAPYSLANRGFSPYGGPMRNALTNGSIGGSTMHSAQQQTMASHGNPAPKDLRIVPLPFYDVAQVLLPPMELPAVTHPSQKYTAKQTFNFSLTSEQQRLINYNPDHKGLPRNEVQLRFFNTTTLREAQKDDFPLNCIVRVNEENIVLPALIPTNKPNTEAKRPSRPVDVTAKCQKRLDYHRLSVEWTADRRSWAVAVYFVYRINSSILFQRLLENPSKHQSNEVTRNEIVKRLSGGDDDGIAMDQIKIGLICPLVKIRMKLPARCLDCTHLQCFDLTSYLMMNEKRPVWNCPVCSGYAPYDRLIIDEYFKDVLLSVDNKTTEVELKKDGRFERLKEEEAFDLSDDSEYGIGIVKHEKTATTTLTTNGNGKLTKIEDDDIIVLSDSDDDDDEDDDNACAGTSNSDRVESATEKNKKRPQSNEIEIITLDDTPPKKLEARRNQQQRVVEDKTSINKLESPTNLAEALASISGSVGGSIHSPPSTTLQMPTASSPVVVAATPSPQPATMMMAPKPVTQTQMTYNNNCGNGRGASSAYQTQPPPPPQYGAYSANQSAHQYQYPLPAHQQHSNNGNGLIGRQMSNMMYSYDQHRMQPPAPPPPTSSQHHSQMPGMINNPSSVMNIPNYWYSASSQYMPSSNYPPMPNNRTE